MKFTKEQARRIVMKCAKQYHAKLLGKKLLIVYRERQDNTIRSIEVVFYDRNYQHLTGLELINHKGIPLHGQSVNFFRKCIENKLSSDDFRFKEDGTAALKLMALPILTDITRITKISGDYNKTKPYLLVDKVIGNVNFCLGLSKDGNVYVPSSALLEDVKKLTNAPSQVLAIFEKECGAKIYTTVKHVTKGLNLNNITLPDEINEIISLKNYIYKGK